MKTLNAIACWHRCRQIGQWLDLSDQRRAQLQTHAQQCEGCHRELERMLQVHARLHNARQAYLGLTYRGTLPVEAERMAPHASETPATRTSWITWKLAPAGLAIACLLGLLVLLQRPESPGPKVSRARYQGMSIPVNIRPMMSVKILPALRKRARMRLATPRFKKPKAVTLRYPKWPSRDRRMSRRDNATYRLRLHQVRPS